MMSAENMLAKPWHREPWPWILMAGPAVGIVAGRAITEASGRIRPDTAPAIAESGVDLMSVGWLTHSATVLDIGLDHRG